MEEHLGLANGAEYLKKLPFRKQTGNQNTPQIGNRPPTCKVGIAGPKENCESAKRKLQQ